MHYGHSHDDSYPHDHTSQHLHHSKVLISALWIAFIFMIIEVIGGWIASSLALLTDALHMFLDVGALMLSLVVVRIVRKPATPKMSYGYLRAEVIGAMASAISLWALCGVLVYEAIMRVMNPREVSGPTVTIIAIIGLVANILMIRMLHKPQQQSLNIRAAYVHVIGDLLGSVAVILTGIVLWVWQWNIFDPIITLLFTGAILFNSGKIIKQTFLILMEATPQQINPSEIKLDLQQIPGVSEVHDLHIWALSSQKNSLSVHLVTKEQPEIILKQAHTILQDKYKIMHCTIQIEKPVDFDPKHCFDCQADSGEFTGH